MSDQTAMTEESTTEAPPSFTAEQIPELVQSQDFAAYAPEDRAWAVDQMLSSAYDHEASLGPWTAERRKAWSQFAQEQHAAAGQSLGETAAEWAAKPVTVPLHIAGGLAQQAVAGTAAQLDYAGSKLGLTDGSAAKQYGEAMDANTGSYLASGRELAARVLSGNQVRSGLDALRQKIDNAEMPMDSPDALHAWMQAQDEALRPARAAWYSSADSGHTRGVAQATPAEDARAWTNGLDEPQNASLLATYMRTHSPAAWAELTRRMETPPDRAAAEQQLQAAQSGTLGQAMDRMGMDPQNLVAAADPVNLAMLGVGGASAKGAAQAATWRGIGSQAMRAAPEMAGFGGVMALRDNPQASGGDVLRSAAEMALGGAGFAAAAGAAGKGYRALKERGARQPAQVTNEANPFEGPIEAPPQPTEDGGVVAPAEAAGGRENINPGPLTEAERAELTRLSHSDNLQGADWQRFNELSDRAKAQDNGSEAFDPVDNPGPEHLPPDQAQVFNIENQAAREQSFRDRAGVGSTVDTPEQRRIADEFMSRVAGDVPGAVRKYIETFGNIVDTDRARELEPAYSAGRDGRREHSRGTSHTANALAKEVYETLLETQPAGEVIFNAGGPGSGKSSSLPPEVTDRAAIVYDTVMADPKRAVQQIDQALAKGHRVLINYVHQPLEAAVRNTIDRAIHPDNGRIVEAYATARGHASAQRAIFDVAEHYRHEPRVKIEVTDNTDFGQRPSSLEELWQARYTEPVASLEKRAMNEAQRYFHEQQANPEFHEDLARRVLREPSQRNDGADPSTRAESGGSREGGRPVAERDAPGAQSGDEELAYRGGSPATRGPLPSTSGHMAPLTTQPRTWSGEVHTLHGIRKYLLDAVGLPAVGVGRFKRALGIYRVKPETVRLQAINDIPVLAHEVGHAIHFRELNTGNRAQAPDWGGVHDAELLPMGRATSLPTYKVDQVRKEGVAEFTRLWLTDPAAARAQAPGFSAFWEAELTARNPRLADGLREAQRRIQDYIAMPAFEKAKAQIVFDPAAERPARTVGEVLRKQYTEWVDTLQPAKRVLKQTAEMAPKLASEAARVEAWMENHRGGWSSKASSDVFGRQTDLQGAVIGEGLQTILKDLPPGDGPAFSTYLALKRAAEIEAQGKRSGFEQGKLPAAEMRALEARFEPMRKKLLKWSDNSLQLLVDSGLLDSDQAATMRTAGRDYVPFYRLYEKVNGVSFGPEQSANGGGFVDLNSGIKHLKGSDRAIIDPLQSLMKNAFMFRKLAEQNHIGVQFFDLMRKLQGHGKFAEGIAPKMKATKIGHDAIVKKLIEEGVIKDASQLPASADLTLTLWEAMKRPDTKTGEVIVFKKGEREHWEVKDAQLMKALKTADADAVRLASFLGPVVTKMLTLPARTLRFGATGGPWFALPNFVRDQFTAAVQSKTGYVPFIDGFKGALEVMRHTDTYQRWREMGGEFSGMTTHTQAFTAMLEDVLPKDRTARSMVTALASPRHWQRALGAAGKLLEEATRVGEFSRGVKRGMSEMEAANASKSVSLNFARSGEISRTVNMLSAFFNAKVQELDMIIGNHRTRPAETIMKGLMYVTAPSVACWLLGKDDKKIQDLPEWRKNLFWNINLDPVAKALGYKEGFVLSLPKPFLMGQIYGTTVERALDHATGRDPNGWRKAAQGLLNAPSEIAETPLNIAGLKPLIEATTNYDFYRGRDIVPDRMKNLPKEQQFDMMTSETAKMLGKGLGMSPIMIDHALRGYFATAGKFGTDAIDWGMTKLGLAEVPPAPEKSLMELPVLNRFTGSPYAANAFVERFYKAADEMEGLLGTFNKQTDQMTSANQKKWWEKHGPDVQFFQRTTNYQTRGTAAGDVRKAQRALSEIGKAMKDIQADKNMAPGVKRERMIELSKQRNATAEKAFRELFPEPFRRKHY